MSSQNTLSMFLKQNKRPRPSVDFAATKSILDAEGKPAVWRLRPLTTVEDENIRDMCVQDVPIPGKKGQFRQKMNASLYMVRQVVAAVEFPNLVSAELQDSYGVKTPEDLVKQMVDNPSEYIDLVNKVREISGFEDDQEDLVEDAKN